MIPAPILDDVVEYLVNRSKEPPQKHYPSSAYKCIRQQYYNWTGVPISNPITAAAAFRIQFGISIHEGFGQIMRDMGCDMVDEMKGQIQVDGLKYPMSFRVDVLRAGEDNTVIGNEFKSTYSQGIIRIQESGSPRDHDLPQIACYAYCTGIEWWELDYLGRDSAYYTSFMCHYEKDRDVMTVYQVKDGTILHSEEHGGYMAEIVSRLQELERAIEDKELPDRPYKMVFKNGEPKAKVQHNKVEYKSDWQCSYCPWMNTCWAEFMGRDGIWYGEDRIA